MADQLEYVRNINIPETGFGYTLGLIGGKFKMPILYCLSLNNGPMRYNAIKRTLGTVSFKSLTNSLRELERDGLISREIFDQVPPKVEYQLTGLGTSLIPVMDALCVWGETHDSSQVNGAKCNID